MKKWLVILLKVLGAILGLFAVTFAIYFFDLDMKLIAKIEPWLQKHYDNMPRKQYV